MLNDFLKIVREGVKLTAHEKMELYRMVGEARVIKTNLRAFNYPEIDVNEEELNLPFKTCWIEPHTDHCLMVFGAGSLNIFIQGILVEEVKPNLLMYYPHIEIDHPENKDLVWNGNITAFDPDRAEELGKERFVNFQHIEHLRNMYKACKQITDMVLSKMAKNEMVISNKETRYRSHKRQTPMIKKVITITENKRFYSCKDKSESINKDFEYSHRFEVRGHWRKIDDNSIGKDREGNYKVEGWTWINNFIKGDLDKPLIKKTRILV